MIDALGPVTVAVPGTPQSLVASLPALTRNLKAYAILIQALSFNGGQVYVGTTGLDRSTLAKVIAVLPVPTASFIPSLGISLTIAPAGVDVGSLYIDANIAGDGVLVTLLVT